MCTDGEISMHCRARWHGTREWINPQTGRLSDGNQMVAYRKDNRFNVTRKRDDRVIVMSDSSAARSVYVSATAPCDNSCIRQYFTMPLEHIDRTGV